VFPRQGLGGSGGMQMPMPVTPVTPNMPGSGAGPMRRMNPQTPIMSRQNRMSFKRGGKVRKSGRAKLHKGEQVLSKRESKKYRSKER
jgi:hypothetical protein